jgi:eukaryotic-like serine/threonine-protein kinase
MAVDPARAKSLFLKASDLADPAERAAYLGRECGGDAELRGRVEALLRANEDFPAPPTGSEAATIDSDVGQIGRQATGVHTPSPDLDASPKSITALYDRNPGIEILIAGRYTLQEKIGEGGMGEVWVAKQSEPVKRKVALKLIKPGMDSRAVLQRFEQERQALALMDHPNIAKVLDAGMTPNGQPFFVMELVNGLPLNRFCDELRLTPKERLELFVPICQAVQHAHQKGIVHRDLKPANILITMIDGKPVPKVIDFGVAKATAGKLTDESMSTQFGAVVGTLEYMSPEQAGFSGEDIDTRADIYSLGVILYELLTGLRPLDAARLKKAALTEMIRIIREDEPSKPSTRLSTDASLPSMAAMRQTDPRKLMNILRGDLDWVVMKCLEKHRERRYETANALARDVQRYLNGDAVEACPPSVGYRMGKFLRRNKGPVLAASFVLLALVAGFIGTAWGLVNADRARRAEAAQRAIAVQEKTKAETREELAIAAVKKFRDAVAGNPELKNSPALAPLRKALLKEPLEFFKSLRVRLQADGDTRPESLARLARASFELGDLNWEIGDKRDALQAYQESLATRERLARDNPGDAGLARGVADAHNNVGIILSETGRRQEALESWGKALAIFERLARDNPADTGIAGELARTHYNIGYVLRDGGRPEEELEAYRKALVIQERLARENPADTGSASALAHTHNNIGVILRDSGRTQEALEAYNKALAIRERLARENPADTAFARVLASSHVNIGSILRDTGRPQEALEASGRALAIFERLARENPAVTGFARDLGATHHNIGFILVETGRPHEALDSWGKALAIRERLARDNPADTGFARDVARVHNCMGGALTETGRPREALESLSRALAILERLARETPADTGIAGDLAVCNNNIGAALSESGRHQESLESHGRALAIFERLARENPAVTGFASDVGGTLNNIATIDLGAGRLDDARNRLLDAVAWQKKALAASPRHPVYLHFLRNHYTNLIRVAKGLGDESLAREAQHGLDDLAATDPGFAALDARLAAVAGGGTPKDNAERLALAGRAHAMRRFALAARLWAEALAADPKLADDRQAQHRYHAACAAALAGSGQGKDDPKPDDAAKAKLRKQALDWLKAELSAWKRVSMIVEPGNKELVAKTLTHWKQDADLAGIRDAKELAKLPDEERAALKQLWGDVEALLTKVHGGK